ncbi:MAG: ABA4-like family protein [Caldilineales bacterium]
MDKLFQLVNLLPMPVWLAMIFAPRARVTRQASRSSVVFALAGLSYVLSLVLAVATGRRSGQSISPQDFTSLDGIRKGFGTREGALAAWTHMLALDLFAGAWIYRESMRLSAPVWVRVPSLVFTLMTGPFGLLIFLVWRVLGGRQPLSLPAGDTASAD